MLVLRKYLDETPYYKISLKKTKNKDNITASKNNSIMFIITVYNLYEEV